MRPLAPALWLTLVCGALGGLGACGGSSPEQPTTSRDRAPVPSPAPAPESQGAKAPPPAEPPPSADGPGIAVGDVAPTFSLPDDTGQEISLEQYRDQRAVLLAFYPKDFTGG